MHLNDLWWRDSGSTSEFWTFTTVPGKRYGAKKPVFVLQRATIIGEPTRGGAHSVAPVKLSATLTLRIPTGRAINPVTKSNWEGSGVQPDVRVEAQDALAEAERHAGGKR